MSTAPASLSDPTHIDTFTLESLLAFEPSTPTSPKLPLFPSSHSPTLSPGFLNMAGGADVVTVAGRGSQSQLPGLNTPVSAFGGSEELARMLMGSPCSDGDFEANEACDSASEAGTQCPVDEEEYAGVQIVNGALVDEASAISKLSALTKGRFKRWREQNQRKLNPSNMTAVLKARRKYQNRVASKVTRERKRKQTASKDKLLQRLREQNEALRSALRQIKDRVGNCGGCRSVFQDIDVDVEDMMA